jgi:hypothetical protein
LCGADALVRPVERSSTDGEAAQRRKNAAHGASRGFWIKKANSPEGAKEN